MQGKGTVNRRKAWTKPRWQGEWNRCRVRQVVRYSWNVSEHGPAVRNRLKSRISIGSPSHAEEFGFYPVDEAVNC